LTEARVGCWCENEDGTVTWYTIRDGKLIPVETLASWAEVNARDAEESKPAPD
jgi:hypothetical protein